jgi:ribosomal protein S18 acetylase RimI-like enzyme
MTAIVRPIEERELPAFVRLRQEALAAHPLAFTASADDDFASSIDDLREGMSKAPDWMLFVAWEEALAGSVGVIRDRHLKAAHRMHLWGMYVAAEFRGRGIGMALLTAAIEHARSVPGIASLHLGVSDNALEARRLYERAGFRAWGVEPDALRAGNESIDEIRMIYSF